MDDFCECFAKERRPTLKDLFCSCIGAESSRSINADPGRLLIFGIAARQAAFSFLTRASFPNYLKENFGSFGKIFYNLFLNVQWITSKNFSCFQICLKSSTIKMNMHRRIRFQICPHPTADLWRTPIFPPQKTSLRLFATP